MKKIRVILAAVLVLALCLSLCGCGAESVAEKYVKARFGEFFNGSDKVDKYMLVTDAETTKAEYGKVKIKTDVERVIELDDDEVDKLVEMISEEYDSEFYKVSDFVKTKNIKKAVCVKVSYEFNGDQIEKYADKNEYFELDGDVYVTLVKEGSSWKVVAGDDIMGVFADDKDADEDDE